MLLTKKEVVRIVFLIMGMFLLGYVLFLRPVQVQIEDQKQKEKSLLSKKYAAPVHVNSLRIRQITRNESINMLMQYAQESNISLKMIDRIKYDISQHYQLVHLALSCRFLELLNFLHVLSSSVFPMMLENIKLHVIEDDSVLVEADLLMELESRPIQGKFFKKNTPENNHFSVLPESVFALSDEFAFTNESKKIPIKQLKLVGYVFQGKHLQGVIKSPNNTIFIAEKGSILGLEQARVMAIDEIRLTLELHGNKIYVLYGEYL